MKSEPIVIIDDDMEDLELFRDIVIEMRFPHPIITFNNSLKALDYLRTAIIHPAFILCDINMPKLDGFQLRTELLKTNTPVNEAPFLFLSTAKMDTEIILANNLKAWAYYTKPNSIEDIKQIFQSIMNLLNINRAK